MSTVSNNNDVQHGCRVNLSVESLIDNEPRRLELRNVWCGKDLKIPLRHQRMRSNKSRWPHFKDVPFPDVQQEQISIIIGTNVPEAFIPLDVRHNGPRAPVAIRSCLGFSILGRIGDDSNYSAQLFTTFVRERMILPLTNKLNRSGNWNHLEVSVAIPYQSLWKINGLRKS